MNNICRADAKTQNSAVAKRIKDADENKSNKKNTKNPIHGIKWEQKLTARLQINKRMEKESK